jgi:N-acyl-D-amino-acid deacylase
MMLSALAAFLLAPTGIVLTGGTVYDGTGAAGIRADVRIVGDTIQSVGTVKPMEGDQVIQVAGLAVTPGFIDAHSHADGGIFENPLAETQIRQGITTAVVGQDGGSNFPLATFFQHLRTEPAALNFGSFVGHGTVRKQVVGDEARASTPEERKRMAALVDQEMRSGALGLSSGLEYQPGRYSDTAELVELAKAAARRKGIYISHMRNEDNRFFEAEKELLDVSRLAKIPAQISHIKLGSARVWGRADEALRKMDELKATADVYPYLYWQSTIRVLIATEEWDERAQWEQGLKDVGGAGNVLLTSYSPDRSWEGKTIDAIAKETGKDPVTVIQEIVRRCYREAEKGSESVVVTAMSEADLKRFIAHPKVMFCSDGNLKGSHPRGAGTFPRILGVYVREQRVIPLAEAIRKMTSFPASRFGFKGRGRLAVGMKADIVAFNPATILDTATTKDPQSAPIGIETVLVNGVPVLLDGKVTGAKPGRPLPK